jgi:lysozyme
MELKKHAIGVAMATSLLMGFEGVRTVAYRDPVGIPTVCMGETRGVVMGDTYTLDQCKAMATARVAEFASGVDNALKVPVSDKTFASFVSFSYNLGIRTFQLRIASLANSGRLEAACRKMGEFSYAHGIQLPGLVRRRQEEVALCLDGLK